jgi:hypothetical protein
MRLYHWTREEQANAILEQGWRNPGYNAEPNMKPGIWFSEDPLDVLRMLGNDSRIVVEVPDGELSDEWRSTLYPTEWVIPAHHLNGWPTTVEPLQRPT